MNELPKIPPRAPEGPEPEFIDEGPGSYLSELGTGKSSVIWGVANCASTLAVGEIVRWTEIGPSSDWFALARLVWILLPASAAILIVLTVWQHMTAYTKKSPGRAVIALATAHLSLGIWFFYSRILELLVKDS